jgi:hypothetical protein
MSPLSTVELPAQPFAQGGRQFREVFSDFFFPATR